MNIRTNIVLDEELVARAMTRAGVTTKKAAVEAALRAYVRAPDYSGLLALAGTGAIAEGYDPKSLAGPARLVSEPAPSYVGIPKSLATRKPVRRRKDRPA